MAIALQASLLGILSWLRDHQGGTTAPSVDDLAGQFNVDRELMQQQLQTLQRYECIQRGGRGNADWSITDQGLLRLTDKNFTPSGAFLSQFDPGRRSPEKSQEVAPSVTMIAVPHDEVAPPPEPEILEPTPVPMSRKWPIDYFR